MFLLSYYGATCDKNNRLLIISPSNMTNLKKISLAQYLENFVVKSL